MFARPEPLTRRPYLGMAEDAHGREQPQYGPEERLFGGFAPASSSEPRSYGALTVEIPATIYLDVFRDDLSPHDRWVARGVEYEVEGSPAAWRSPFSGWEPGTVIQLRRVEG